MKQRVCKNCKQSVIGANIETGQEVCLICNSTEFEEVDLPDELTCIYCKKVWKTEEILKVWHDVPFLDMKNKTFYDGCRGWE